MLLILMCAGAMSGLTGCGNNTNNTDDNAVSEVKDGVEDGVDDIVDDLDGKTKSTKQGCRGEGKISFRHPSLLSGALAANWTAAL